MFCRTTYPILKGTIYLYWLEFATSSSYSHQEHNKTYKIHHSFPSILLNLSSIVTCCSSTFSSLCSMAFSLSKRLFTRSKRPFNLSKRMLMLSSIAANFPLICSGVRSGTLIFPVPKKSSNISLQRLIILKRSVPLSKTNHAMPAIPNPVYTG